MVWPLNGALGTSIRCFLPGSMTDAAGIFEPPTLVPLAKPPHLRDPDFKAPRSEPIEAWVNQAELPTLTDQGEQSAPGEMADPDR